MDAKRSTIKDVAREAGVSASTVSNALTGRRPVDEATRQSVQDVARRLFYVPDPRAQRLRTGRPAAIALVSSMPSAVAAGPSRLGFMMETAAAAAVVALESGLAVVLVPPTDEAGPSLGHLDVGGALVVEPVADDPHLHFLLDRACPVVSIGRPGPEADIPFVDIHSAYSARLLLQHLHAGGARRIALLAGAQLRNSYAESIAEYRCFAARHGMVEHVVLLDEAGGEQAGHDAALTLLRAHPELDALCVSVDAFAVGAVRAAQRLGRSVPGDLRIVTRYDGVRARLCDPPLTALDLHLDDVSRHAVGLLLGLLGLPAPVTSVPLPELVPRHSSA